MTYTHEDAAGTWHIRMLQESQCHDRCPSQLLPKIKRPSGKSWPLLMLNSLSFWAPPKLTTMNDPFLPQSLPCSRPFALSLTLCQTHFLLTQGMMVKEAECCTVCAGRVTWPRVGKYARNQRGGFSSDSQWPWQGVLPVGIVKQDWETKSEEMDLLSIEPE